jgi:hypothetical protein
MQNIYLLVGSVIAPTHIDYTDGLFDFFVSVNFLGFFRLSATYWILNDFRYTFNRARQLKSRLKLRD